MYVPHYIFYLFWVAMFPSIDGSRSFSVKMNNIPAPKMKNPAIIIGADGAKATAKNPARSGGKA
jgi:hypothetical protein